MFDVTVFASQHAEQRFRSAYDAVLARWPEGREERRVTTCYGITTVQVCGVDDGVPVLLLNGAGSTAASWFANVGALAGTCRLFAPDRPGEAGLSERGPVPVAERDDWMSWISTVLDRLGVERCAIVGHSYGAWMALSYAVQVSRRVSHLALIDPSSCFKGGRTGYNLRAIPLFVRPTADRVRAFLDWETGGRGLDPALVDLVASGVADFPSARVVFPTRPSDRDLAGLDVPTLVVLPEESRQNDPGRTAASVRRRLPGARVLRLPGHTHHTVPQQEPEALNRALLDLLALRC